MLPYILFESLTDRGWAQPHLAPTLKLKQHLDCYAITDGDSVRTNVPASIQSLTFLFSAPNYIMKAKNEYYNFLNVWFLFIRANPSVASS